MMKLFSAAFLMALVSSCAGMVENHSVVGPTGSVVNIADGLTLSIPAGALPEGTALTVRDTSFGAGEHELEFEPRGLVLSIPATLTVRDDDDASFESEQELEIERSDDGASLRLGTLGHVSIRKAGSTSGASHARKRCKYVLISSDPATGTNVWVCRIIGV